MEAMKRYLFLHNYNIYSLMKGSHYDAFAFLTANNSELYLVIGGTGLIHYVRFQTHSIQAFNVLV